ncbi:glycosyltransferase family 25 protein [bacterium]|jgi:GR25 family glycosyltransferase involved in LPS biosynthesis|nr:glycosyltransferase family 25 protein [bacterium]
MGNKIDKIYLLHHKPMIERYNIINKRLEEENVDVEWVEHFSPDDIGNKYEEYLKNWDRYEDILIKQPHGNYQNFSKKISMNSLSLILKHKYCFEEQINNNYENIIILEDDCEIVKNFNNMIDDIFSEFQILMKEENVGMITLGTSHGFKSRSIDNYKYIHYFENQKTRCTHAMLYNIETTKKILNRFDILNLPIDFKLNEIIQVEDIRVAWLEPGFIQIF